MGFPERNYCSGFSAEVQVNEHKMFMKSLFFYLTD